MPKNNIRKLKKLLKKSDVRFVRIVWCDNANLIRGKAVHRDTIFASTLAIDRNREVIDSIAEALIAQKIPVEQYYPESGPGQHEISMRYAPAMVAANRQIVFRETVKAIIHQHHLQASFLPKIFADAAGSGCHIHLSLWQNGKNLVPDAYSKYGLSSVAQAFIAGVLDHLLALMKLRSPPIRGIISSLVILTLSVSKFCSTTLHCSFI